MITKMTLQSSKFLVVPVEGYEKLIVKMVNNMKGRIIKPNGDWKDKKRNKHELLNLKFERKLRKLEWLVNNRKT